MNNKLREEYKRIRYEHWMLISLHQILNQIQRVLEKDSFKVIRDESNNIVNTTGSSIGMVSSRENKIEMDEIMVVKKNAYLESFLIHSRVLTEFFFFDPTRNYVRITNFFTKHFWNKKCQEEFNNFLEMKKYLLSKQMVFTNISVEVAHIVKSSSKTTWDRAMIHEYLDSLCRLFFSIVKKRKII